MRSSYIENDYGSLLASFVKVFRPSVVHDFGVLDGYSSSCFIEGLNSIGLGGKIFLVDMFEDYPYKSSEEKWVRDNIERGEGDDIDVSFIRGNVFDDDVVSKFEDGSLEFIHIDLSNNGDKLDMFFEKYANKMKDSCFIIAEGGSKERDSVGWMVENRKPPIREFLSNLVGYDMFVFEPFPSLTILRKTCLV